MQYAIDNCPKYGKIICLGEFVIDKPIVPKSYVSIRYGRVIVVSGGRLVYNASSISDFVLEDFYLDASICDLIPINFGGVGRKENIVIRNAVIYGTSERAGKSIWIGGSPEGVYYCLFENIWFIECSRGIHSNCLSYSTIRNIYGINIRHELLFIAGFPQQEAPYPHCNVIENVKVNNDESIWNKILTGEYNSIVVDATASYRNIIRNIEAYNVNKVINLDPA